MTVGYEDCTSTGWIWSWKNQCLLDAVRKGDLQTLQACLRVGADINYQGTPGETALHISIVQRNYGILKQLVKVPEIDLNVRNLFKNTPLILACQLGSYPFAKTLLRAGADKNISGWCGHTAIDIARERGFDDIVDLLQSHGFQKYSSLEQSLTIDEEKEVLSQYLTEENNPTEFPLTSEEAPPQNFQDIVKDAKTTVEDYSKRFQEIEEMYLKIFEELQNWTQMKQVISRWNGKHYRLEITGTEMAQEKEEVTVPTPTNNTDNFSDTGISSYLESMQNRFTDTQTSETITEEKLDMIQNDIYSAEDINTYVYEVYRNRAEELCISIIQGKKDLVENYVHRNHGNIYIHFLEQPDFNTATFLAGGDFVEKSAIGPGCCFTTVDDSFQDLHNLDNLQFSRVISGNNTGCSLSWGSLGCFARVSDVDSNKLYSLSAKHVIEKQDSAQGNDANMITGIAVQKDVDCFPEEELRESFPLSFDRALHVSKSYTGVQGRFRTSQNGYKEVDVVMLGPIFESILERHEPFSPLYEINIATGFYGARVRKIGAATGLTKGQIIGVIVPLGLYVVVNRISEETGQDMEHISQPFAKPGDSGAIVLLDNNDESSEVQGIGIVHKTLSQYTDGRNEEAVYRNAVLCVRLDYCTEALSQFPEFKDFNNRFKLYLQHLHPNFQLQLQQMNQ